ncbi:MAG: hypothetical protein KatS3mg027_2167 [Bacteroidia bacterium]|nr:MAG: hypothetical protein KatS3mg027_2167 [Bacteroidia bacterium]
MKKTALGATLSVDWRYFDTTREAIDYLKKNNYKVLAVEQNEKSELLQNIQIQLKEKIGIIFGNEITGITEEILNSSDVIVEIPQMGTKHSLNVAVCGGIVCWELLKKMERI